MERNEVCAFQSTQDMSLKTISKTQHMRDKAFKLSMLTADRITKVIVDFPMKIFKSVCHVTIGQTTCH